MDSRRHHKSCCAEWCRNSSRHTGIKFFRIPADERSRAWLQYARRQDLAHLPPRQIYSSYRLCSAHFTSRDYADPGQTGLLRCAVPTVSIFGDGQTHVQSPGSRRPANTTAMPAHSADEEVQQTEPSCSNPAGRQHKPSRCSPRTARKMKNLEKINSRLRKALSRIGKRKVCHYMDCRSKKQLINRYHWSLYPNMQRGRWSAQEDVMLLVAVKLCGDVSWSKVASMVPGRTHSQCRDRYMDNFAQQFVLGPFTSDEDCTLLQLVQKYGAGHWAMAARDMPWRASNTLLMRYRRLYETLRTKEPTVAGVERSLAVPVAPMTAVRCARLTGMDKRMDLYRRIRRLLNTDVMKRAALSLVKCCTTSTACRDHLRTQKLRKWAPCPSLKSSSLRRCLACQMHSRPKKAASCFRCCCPTSMHGASMSVTSPVLDVPAEATAQAATLVSTETPQVALASCTVPEDDVMEIDGLFTPLKALPLQRPPSTIVNASIAYIAGFVAKAVEERRTCTFCPSLHQSDGFSPVLMGLISLKSRGGLTFPKPEFVMVLVTIKKAVDIALPHIKKSNVRQQLAELILPHLE
ncbi:uncharacterized protein LOC119186319 isoform X5 [Rhipicephalus microplus]|uniref:uncharacterized protein LOC119186319 isoform X5 n=1 Tax=Rhipicephalus microplus TaxID=6941 RepID=UPI003F6AA307